MYALCLCIVFGWIVKSAFMEETQLCGKNAERSGLNCFSDLQFTNQIKINTSCQMYLIWHFEILSLSLVLLQKLCEHGARSLLQGIACFVVTGSQYRRRIMSILDTIMFDQQYPEHPQLEFFDSQLIQQVCNEVNCLIKHILSITLCHTSMCWFA